MDIFTLCQQGLLGRPLGDEQGPVNVARRAGLPWPFPPTSTVVWPYHSFATCCPVVSQTQRQTTNGRSTVA